MNEDASIIRGKMAFLDEVCQERRAKLVEQNRERHIATYAPLSGMYMQEGDKKLLSFCSNDYLGLSQHPEVLALFRKEHKRIGSGASRLVSGNGVAYDELEAQLAQIKNTEAACVFGSGYLANIGTISSLMGKDDLIISDRLVHACILDGIKLAGSTHKRFKHNDVESLELLLAKHRKDYRYCLIVTETIFSMDGDIAPLNAIIACAKAYDAWTMTDDAHGFGVLKNDQQADIQMGTLSKAVGAYGGYVCATQEVIDFIKNTARSLVFSTALPPMVLEASCCALAVMNKQPELTKDVIAKSNAFCEVLGVAPTGTPIVPFIVGADKAAVELQHKLYRLGYLVKAIRPPTVPENTARLRITFSALHEVGDVLRLADDIKKLDVHI